MGNGSSPRIGLAERAEAQRALDVHLNAGRLQMDEYADRSAAAANATVAGELAALFSDLPAPRPKLPGMSGSGGSKGLRNGIVAAVVGLGLVIAAVVFFAGAAGRSSPSAPTALPVNSSAQPTSSPALPATVTSDPASQTSDPAGPSEDQAAPENATVRHQGTLRIVGGGQGLDLDAPQSDAQWAENDPNAIADIGFSYQQISFQNNTRYTILGDRKADYGTCSTVNGYITDDISYRDITAGQYLCVLTSDRRYVAAEVTKVDVSGADMSIVSYDPPIGG